MFKQIENFIQFLGREYPATCFTLFCVWLSIAAVLIGIPCIAGYMISFLPWIKKPQPPTPPELTKVDFVIFGDEIKKQISCLTEAHCEQLNQELADFIDSRSMGVAGREIIGDKPPVCGSDELPEPTVYKTKGGLS